MQRLVVNIEMKAYECFLMKERKRPMSVDAKKSDRRDINTFSSKVLSETVL